MGTVLIFIIIAFVVLVLLFVVLPISLVVSGKRNRLERLKTAKLFARHLETSVFPIDVRVVPLPACVRSLGAKIVGTIILEFYFAALLYAIFYSRPSTKYEDAELLAQIMGGLMIVVGIVVPVMIVRSVLRARRFLTPELQDHPEAPLLETLTKARIPGRASRSRRARMVWARLAGLLDPAHRPRSVIDTLFLTAVEDIELVSELREPTPIVSGPVRTRRDGVSLLIVLAIALLACAGAELYWVMAIIGTCIVYILLTTPWIRNMVPGLRLESRAMLAGPGFIRSRNGTAWTCDEAVLIVRSASGKRQGTDPIQAQFIGPAGLATIEFSSSRDEDFRALWANWNSTNPRPELAEAPI